MPSDRPSRLAHTGSGAEEPLPSLAVARATGTVASVPPPSAAIGVEPAEVADHVDELGVGRHDDLAVLVERALDGLELAQHLGVAHEVLVGRLVDELDGLGLALGLQDLGLPYALGLLDLGAAGAVGLRLGRGGEVDGCDLLVLGLDDLVHGLLHVARRVDLLELGAQDLDAPGGRLDHAACVRSSSLILPRSELADFSESVPMMLRSVVRARLTTWIS